MILNCIVVDDESTSRVQLSSRVENSSSLNLVGTAASGKEALELMSVEKVDLIFLDVMMPSMSGFEFLDEIQDNRDVKVILVTGEEKFAVKAFDYAITDYLVKPVSKHRFSKAVDRVLNSIAAQTGSDIPNNLLLLKLIRYMHTREIEVLEPIPTRRNLLGYSYPMLTDNLDFHNEAVALNILDEAEESEILSGQFVDTIYLCNSCSNSYLHIREVCPNCNSSHLKSNDLVHHFSCAYMGEVDEFKTEGKGNLLICPKCERKLKHIGVDYDKPSAIFHCKDCDHSFQDPLLRAKCINCDADQKVEHLEKKEIKKYRLTAKGKDLAEGNRYVQLQKPSRVMQDQGQNTEYFKRALKSEINRKSMVDFESSVGIFRLVNIEELYQQVGNSGKQQLISELHSMLSSELDAGDEITFWDYETILVLFPEQNREQAIRIMDRVRERMEVLLADNFSGFELELKEAAKPVEEGTSYDKIINGLLEKANKREA